RARDVSRPYAGPRLGFLAAEARGAPRIHHLLRFGFKIAPYRLEIAKDFRIRLRREMTSADRGGAVAGALDRAALALPFGKAPVEHRRLGMTHGAHHPPATRGRVDAGAVVEDDDMIVADAELAYAARERDGVGKHMGQGGLLV